MWTEERQAALVNLAKQGFTGHEIGMRLGITRSAAIARLRRTSVPLNRARPQANKELIQARRHEIKQLVELGRTVPEIAAHLGKSRGAIRYYLKTLNVVARPAARNRFSKGHNIRPHTQTGGKPYEHAPARRASPALRAARTAVLKTVAELNDEHIPLEQRKALHELTSKTCRWPVGDPCKPGFFYCGAEPFAHWPYCKDHCARAYLVGE